MSISSVYRFGTDVELIGAAALWLVLILRIPSARRSRQQRMLLFAAAGLAGSITVYLDPVSAALKGTFVFAESCGLFMNIWGVLSSALILDFVLAATSGRRARLIYLLTAAVTATLIVLNFTIAPHSGCVTSVVVPWYSPFWWLLIFTHLVATVPCAALCARYSYQAREDRSLRTGLLLLAAGFASSTLFWSVVLGFLLTRLPWLGAIFPLNIGVTAWLMTAGVSLPLMLSLYRQTWNAIALWRLWPLWRDLIESVPHVALDKPGARIRQLLGRPGSVYLRLYRVVIEIRDAMLVLSDYTGAEDVARARAHVAGCDLSEDEVDAAITACWLERARQNRANGVARGHGAAAFTAQQGDDLPSEVHSLVKVQRARRSPLVRSFISPQADAKDQPAGRVQPETTRS
ncbi:hypothetical protein HC031_13430 [Planosporangium thailandense]|uniref:DUF6545 domain-containing protein n=1 Tax=Planosporangium thailandense TaxID=765197 RepID=A0ABX0XXC5_9ACTN|nr:MAB_1171c family putative transporter [Planosporangium thailandense]NJC70708.1 hypothetical protein [Planosporangium thailandense]